MSNVGKGGGGEGVGLEEVVEGVLAAEQLLMIQFFRKNESRLCEIQSMRGSLSVLICNDTGRALCTRKNSRHLGVHDKSKIGLSL